MPHAPVYLRSAFERVISLGCRPSIQKGTPFSSVLFRCFLFSFSHVHLGTPFSPSPPPEVFYSPQLLFLTPPPLPLTLTHSPLGTLTPEILYNPSGTLLTSAHMQSQRIDSYHAAVGLRPPTINYCSPDFASGFVFTLFSVSPASTLQL